MEIEAVAAPEGSSCARHPEQPAVFVCARCGDYACERCIGVRRREARCRSCDELPESLPAELGPRLKFLYLSLDGRIPRSTWWLYGYVPMTVVHLVTVLAPFLAARSSSKLPSALGTAIVVTSLLTIWPVIAISVKRLHDRDHSGFWLLTVLIPLLGPLLLFIELGFLRGDATHNRYGAPPA